MKLRTALIFAVDVMLFGLSAWSQNTPKWEVPLDYSYVHYQAIDFESRNGDYFFGQQLRSERRRRRNRVQLQPHDRIQG